MARLHFRLQVIKHIAGNQKFIHVNNYIVDTRTTIASFFSLLLKKIPEGNCELQTLKQ